MLTIAQSSSFRLMSGAPGHATTFSLTVGVIVLVGIDVALAVGVFVGASVGVLEGAVVAETAGILVELGKEVCVGVALWLQATRIAVMKTTHRVRLIALLNMLPPFHLGHPDPFRSHEFLITFWIIQCCNPTLDQMPVNRKYSPSPESDRGW
jgi:hypothetical protein